MRRFLITSDKFSGQAELLFNEKETLIRIDMSETLMDEMLVQRFKSAVPSTIHQLMQGHCFGAGTTVIEADFEVTFELFWKDYPNKRNRFRAEKLWGNMKKSDQVKAFMSLHGYKAYLTKHDWVGVMGADRYLSEKQFETEWKKV